MPSPVNRKPAQQRGATVRGQQDPYKKVGRIYFITVVQIIENIIGRILSNYNTPENNFYL
jgi:hypothetical protein